ncbi:MAG: GNAT family N-acetyltransferase [Chloroflexi bacterium]|nr:GNAT family N-acetyltransferase [Chloroflexota bacterium]
MIILETDRLIVSQLSLEDAPFILELLNEPSFIQNIGDRGVRTLDDARNYLLSGPLKSYEQHGFGLFMTKLKSNNLPIGMCGLIKRDGLDDVDIGYAFMPQFWGKGYASEAGTAVLYYGTNRLNLPRIIAITSPDNHGSIRVLEKIGLIFDKMITLPGVGGESKLFIPA